MRTINDKADWFIEKEGEFVIFTIKGNSGFELKTKFTKHQAIKLARDFMAAVEEIIDDRN